MGVLLIGIGALALNSDFLNVHIDLAFIYSELGREAEPGLRWQKSCSSIPISLWRV